MDENKCRVSAGSRGRQPRNGGPPSKAAGIKASETIDTDSHRSLLPVACFPVYPWLDLESAEQPIAGLSTRLLTSSPALVIPAEGT
jgi:hypothetical protein